MAENIRVAVRIRPENPAEVRGAHGIVVKPLDEEGLVFDPDESYGTQSSGPSCYRRKARDVHFHFDRVFDEQSTQQDVYDGTSKNIMDGIFSGFNCSVLAYGATGAGKTHTMLGSEESPGLIFLIMMELYRRMDELNEEKVCDITISYLEVYNETIRDLLKPSKPLAVREDPQKGVVVSQLSAHKPVDAHDLLRMLSTGNNNRTQHPTDANATSSRSHAVFQVLLQQKPRTAGLSAEVRTAKLLLVDLAGSERATVSKNRGERQREGANINRSLLALGNCINALAAGNSKGHIPYRDSKLTRLLKDSLGGNCRTAFIANVSPSSLSYEDTLNTLRYAERAKKIKVKLSENRSKIDFHATRYRGIVADLQKEVADLKRRLMASKGGDPTEKANTTAACQLLQKVQQETREIIDEKLALRQRLRDIQASQRDNITLALRTSRLKARVQCLIPDDKRILGKLDARLTTLGQREEELDDQYSELQGQLKDNAAKWSASYSSAIASMTVLANKVQWLRPSIQQVLDARRLEVHEVEHGRELKHLRHFANSQKLDAENTETLVQQALRLIQYQQRRLTACGGLTDDLQHTYSLLVRTVQGAKSLAWADGQNTATTPRQNLNRSFVESSPFKKLRQHRQMLAAALRSPPHLSDELSPVGNGPCRPVVSRTASHESVIPKIGTAAAASKPVAQSGSGTSINAQPSLRPTRGIMAMPGTSLFRSPGETPPARPALQAQPDSPETYGRAAASTAHSSASTHASSGHPTAYSPLCSAAAAASGGGHTSLPVSSGMAARGVQTPEQRRHVHYAASPENAAAMITSTPGVALLASRSSAPPIAPPSELAFTPVVSRSDAMSSSSAFSRPPQATSPQVPSSVLQPAYMMSAPTCLTSRRGHSSAFFAAPAPAQVAHDQAAGAADPGYAATSVEDAGAGEQQENMRDAAVSLDVPPPSSPGTFILSAPAQENLDCTITISGSPVNAGTAGRREASPETAADGQQAAALLTAADVSAFLPPPPPGLKGTRQRVRGVIDAPSRPSNIGLTGDGHDSDGASEPGESTFILEQAVPVADGTVSADSHGSGVASAPTAAPVAAVPAPAPAAMTTAAATAAVSSKQPARVHHGARAVSAAGSMSLAGSLRSKPAASKPRPSTFGGTGRKQNFASLTASARAKQLPVRGRWDENTEPQVVPPRRAVAKSSAQLEAFKAKLNTKPAVSGVNRSNRTSRQTTFG